MSASWAGMSNEKDRNMANSKKNNKALYIAAAVCAVCVLFMLIALLAPKEAERGEFTPPEFDPAAQQGTPDVPAELGWFTPQAEGLTLRVSLCGEVLVKDGKADVYFTNHSENENWMLLRVLDAEGNILAQTGIIKPGEYLKTIEFDTVPQDGQAIVYKVMSYEPDTYYSAGSITLRTTAQLG